MTEENQEKQDGQKTVVAFIVGLLVGGLLVWVFSGSGTDAPVDDVVDDVTEEVSDTDSEDASSSDNDEAEPDTAPSNGGQAADKGGNDMVVGEADVEISDQPAGMVVELDGATFPTDTGWIGVRTYANDQLGSVLGVALYSKAEGLVPEQIPLLSPTVPGNEYAIVFYTEDGDRQFTLANDVQIDTSITTFTAR